MAVPDLPQVTGDLAGPHAEVHRLRDRPGADVESHAAGQAVVVHPALPVGVLDVAASAAGAGG